MSWLRRWLIRLLYRVWNPPWYEHLFFTLQTVYLARAYFIVAELGVADLLQKRPMRCDELAEATGAHGPSLYRVLRALAAFGVFAEDSHGVFRLTRRARALLSEGSGPVRDWLLFTGAAPGWHAYAAAPEGVRTGSVPFDIVHGKGMWAYQLEHPDLAERFLRGQNTWTAWQAAEIVAAYDFGRFGRVIDVGGGLGNLTAQVLRIHPSARAVLYDQPETIERARSRIAAAGLAGRCEMVGGSFLESVPGGGDAYVLKHVLRDWDDAGACRILENCRRAMPDQAVLLVIDALIDPRNGVDRVVKLIDLEQMLWVGGSIRTRAEFETLFHRTGLRLVRVVPTSIADTQIMEVRKARPQPMR